MFRPLAWPQIGDEWAPVLFMVDWPIGVISFYAICFDGFHGLAAKVWPWVAFWAFSILGVYWHFVWPQLIASAIRLFASIVRKNK